MPRKRWVQIGGKLVDVTDAEFIDDPMAPMIMPDISPYRSMIDGSIIKSRSDHRAHLKQHGCIEIGNETKYLQPKPVKPPPGLKETIIGVANEKLRYQ